MTYDLLKRRFKYKNALFFYLLFYENGFYAAFLNRLMRKEDFDELIRNKVHKIEKKYIGEYL